MSVCVRIAGTFFSLSRNNKSTNRWKLSEQIRNECSQRERKQVENLIKFQFESNSLSALIFGRDKLQPWYGTHAATVAAAAAAQTHEMDEHRYESKPKFGRAN